MKPFYSDNFIEVLTFAFSKFSHDLIIDILSFLSIEKILEVQPLINNEYIKQVKLRRITKQNLEFMIPNQESHEIIDQQIQQVYQTFFDVNCLNKRKQDNTVPVQFYFREIQISPFEHINKWIDGSANFELHLTFDFLGINECRKLESFKTPACIVSIIIISIQLDNTTETSLELDFSNFKNLKKVVISGAYLSCLKLDSSFQSLTVLGISDIYDEEYLSKFINLRSLTICFKKNLKIKSLPRNITSLKLSPSTRAARVLISSSNEWPTYLQSLKLFSMRNQTFTEISTYSLPSEITELSLECYYISDILKQISGTVTELKLFSTNIDSEHIYSNGIFLPGIQKLSIMDVNLVIDGENSIIYSPTGLEYFYLHIVENKLSISPNNFCFAHSRSTLKVLDMFFEENPGSMNYLDFSEFKSLTSIKLISCNIVNLNTFIPPASIQTLVIESDKIKAIDETCTFLNDSVKYTNLHEISFLDCEVDFISPKIKLPVNLSNLSMPDLKDKQLLLNIIHHKALLSLTFGELDNLDMFENVEGTKVSSIKEMNIYMSCKVEKNTLFSMVEKSLGKQILHSRKCDECFYLKL